MAGYRLYKAKVSQGHISLLAPITCCLDWTYLGVGYYAGMPRYAKSATGRNLLLTCSNLGLGLKVQSSTV